MKKQYEILFRLIKQLFNALLSFSGSLSGMFNVCNYTTFITLYNQPYITRPTLKFKA